MEKGKIGGIRTPKPLNRLSQDYVGDMTQQAKFQTDRPVGAPRQMGEISLLRGF